MEMLKLRIDLPSMYAELRQHRLPARAQDTGYFVHAFLSAVFSGKPPSPFYVVGTRGRSLEVLAYSEHSAQALTEMARQTGSKGTEISGKPLPAALPADQVYRFSLLACPVVRMAKAGRNHKKGAEVDVFLREAWRLGPAHHVDREAVYSSWLGEQMQRQGGAKLLDAAVTQVTQCKLLRKTQGRDRKSRLANKPVVQFSGRLRVSDSQLFGNMLSRGIGRHRAFGFGMLLLRRG